MIGCVVVSDRADLYLPQTLDELARTLPGDMPLRVIDDREHRLGMAGAVRLAWQVALDEGWEALLHWEEDFRVRGGVPLDDMADCLARFPFLSQVALKRQAWNTEELAAGGLVEAHAGEFLERRVTGRYWYTVTRRIFSLNPCLIPRRVLKIGWPDGNEAEMTERLNADPRNLFALYGRRFDAPRVEHVGRMRSAGWKL